MRSDMATKNFFISKASNYNAVIPYIARLFNYCDKIITIVLRYVNKLAHIN
jgi:hypothetical protein